MSDKPRVIGGRFRLERLIGQGGIGKVFYAIDQQTGTPVAVKAIKPQVVAQDPKLLERFRREGQALKELNHPNIVKILTILVEDYQHYLVMEYVAGGSLYDVLKTKGPLPVNVVLQIALDLSDALTRAHRLHIIHRDIKPANVLLARDGTPRLTDFGAARLEEMTPLTLEGAVVGTVPYLSPEACRGDDIDHRTDIWSFGIMLFEMLTGKRPYDRHEIMATVLAIVRDPLPDLVTLWPDAPPKLINLIYRMLEKDPEQRIGSMRQVGAELEAIIEHSGSGTREALNLIYRMLESDAVTSDGMRAVSEKLGVNMNRSYEQPLPLTPERKTALDLSEYEMPMAPALSRDEDKESSTATNRMVLFIGGVVIIVAVLVVLLAMLL